MSEQREQGWYWVKLGDEWRPACYDAALEKTSPGLAWWIDDYTVDDSMFEAIGPRIRMPDEAPPAPYGWACENRSPSGVLLGVRFVAGEIPTGRNRTEHWFPVWRYADLEVLITLPTITIEGPTATQIAEQIRDAERLVSRERAIAKHHMAYEALELALSVAGSSMHKHLSPADALNWLVEHHKQAALQSMQGEAVWSGWACQYPGKMPRLYGNKKIAELNHYPEEGDKLMFLSAQVAATEISSTPAPAIYGLRNVVSRAWDGETTVPADRAGEYDADALVPLYTHSQSPSVPDIDWLSNVIRKVDGNHKLGAGALAEKIVEAMLTASGKGE